MPDKITSRFGNSVLLSTIFVAFLTVFFVGLSLYALSMMVVSGTIALVASLALLIYAALWIVTVRYFLGEAPRVTIDRRGVWYRALFARSGFHWEDVVKINLLTTESHHFEQAEATTFKLKSKQKFVIWVELYTNGAALRQVVDQAQELLHAGKTIGPNLQFEPVFRNIEVDFIDTNEPEVFAGNHVFSIRGIGFYGINLMLIYLSIKDGNVDAYILIAHAFSWVFGYEFYYFQMTKDYFIVKHHLFFWYQKIIPLSEIRECVFYQKFRRANALRVILKDFRSFRFPAGSLSELHWHNLRKALKHSNIPLRGSF